MSGSDEKLKKLFNIVIKDAVDEKREIMTQIENTRREQIENNEERVLRKAFDVIQKEKSGIIAEANGRVSKKSIECKRELFRARDEIVSGVVSNVKTRLDEFTKTDEYREFLRKKIENMIILAGSGQITVAVCERDMDTARAIGGEITLETLPETAIGGAVVINKDKNIMINETLASKLEEQRAEFIRSRGGVIGDIWN